MGNIFCLLVKRTVKPLHLSINKFGPNSTRSLLLGLHVPEIPEQPRKTALFCPSCTLKQSVFWREEGLAAE